MDRYHSIVGLPFRWWQTEEPIRMPDVGMYSASEKTDLPRWPLGNAVDPRYSGRFFPNGL